MRKLKAAVLAALITGFIVIAASCETDVPNPPKAPKPPKVPAEAGVID